MDFIVADEDAGTVTIDGVVTIEGEVLDAKIATCHKCGSPGIYYQEYDADFCAYCNRWLKKGCGDATCIYCGQRPVKPLPDENERRIMRYT